MQSKAQTVSLEGNKQEVSRETSKRRQLLVGSVLLVLTIICVMLIPPILRLRAKMQLTACLSTIKNIAESAEMYASDNSGSYPPSLDVLVGPKYRLPSVPKCGVGKMTYLDYQVSTKPDNFSFSCCGDNHKRAYADVAADSTGFPRYNAEIGFYGPDYDPLQERP